MKLLLVCDILMINNIFKLIAKKIGLEIDVQNNTVLAKKYDMIIIHEKFIGDFEHLQKSCLTFGLISSSKNVVNIKQDFSIRSPFLPKELSSLLDKEQVILREKKRSERIELSKEHEKIYLESLANNINFDEEPRKRKEEDLSFNKKVLNSPRKVNSRNLSDIKIPKNIKKEHSISSSHNSRISNNSKISDNFSDDSNEDESIVLLKQNPEAGGILDKTELSKIKGILSREKRQIKKQERKIEKIEKIEKKETKKKASNMEDLSEIIDKAIDEARLEEFKKQGYTDDNLDLGLDNVKFKEFRSMFKKLDPKIVNDLLRGEKINLKLHLKEDDEDL